jgi:hypothetical protein
LVTGEVRDEDGFSSSDIRTQSKILETYRDAIWRSWNEHWQRQENRG